jgi:DNA-binding transcriptional LysR family regulator
MRSFSKVARELNITQPALSKQIMCLETELGVKLFDRTVNPLNLTPAGEHFLRKAEKLIYEEEQLVSSMEQFREEKAGQLVIGIPPVRSSYLISDVIKKVREKFPKVQVKLHEVSSDTLREELKEGKYDFAIVNLPVDESVLVIKPIEPDRLVLVVPNELKDRIPDVQDEKEIDFKDCSKLPFVTLGEEQEMRKLFDKLCATADFIPEIAVESVKLSTTWTMARDGIAATILPYQFIEKENLCNVIIFDIKDLQYLRQPAVVYKRGQYLTDYAKYAIELLTQ